MALTRELIGVTLTDVFYYVVLVGSTLELIYRIQNIFRRLGNCGAGSVLDNVQICINLEVSLVKIATFNVGGYTYIELWRVICYGCALQIVMIVIFQPNLPAISSVCLMILICLSSWLFRRCEHDMGYGLAWSYYLGYLKIMLPEIMGSQRTFDGEEIAGLFILVPYDCQIHDSITKQDSRVVFKGNFEPIKKDVGGIKNRVYFHSVYEVKGGRQGRSFLAFLEYATPLKHLATMSGDGYGDSIPFTKQERLYQLRSFTATLEHILREHASKDVPRDEGKLVEDFVQLIYIRPGDGIAARIGEKEWNMSGHNPSTSIVEPRPGLIAEESIEGYNGSGRCEI